MSAHLKLGLTAFLWAGAFFAARVAMQTVSPVSSGFVRFAIASLMMLLIVFVSGQTFPVNTSDWIGFVFLGFTGIFLYNLFFFNGLKLTSSVNGSLIVGANPGITALLSFIFRFEKPDVRRMIGIPISFLGLLIVISRGSLDVITHMEFEKGDLIMLGAPACWAVYSIAGKKSVGRSSPLIATTAACIVGTLFLFPFAMREGIDSTGLVSIPFWLATLYMAGFSSAIAYVWWYEGVKEIGASRSAIYVNLVPVFVMIISAFTGTLPNWAQIVGAAFVILGVYITSTGRANPAQISARNN